MCLIFISINDHPNYKLIVVANRDEFYSRKTAAAEFWPDHPHLLGGRDLEAGGTWLGMTREGKIAMITNYRDLKNILPAAPSRGHLASDYLIANVTAENHLNEIAKSASLYNGFNMVAGNASTLWYFSNYGKGVERLSKGFFGLSNHLLDTPWPKVVRGKERLKPLLQQAVIDTDQLFEFLYDEKIAKDDQLPDTGIGLERERALSSMFIKTPNYGSRCSTVLLVDKNNRVSFSERVYDLKTFEYKTGRFEFDIDEA